MPLAPQTVALLQVARQLIQELPADAVLLLAAAEDGSLTERLKSHPELTVLEIDPGPTPRQERMSLALLEAVRSDRLRQGADVIALYNGIDVGEEKTEP